MPERAGVGCAAPPDPERTRGETRQGPDRVYRPGPLPLVAPSRTEVTVAELGVACHK